MTFNRPPILKLPHLANNSSQKQLQKMAQIGKPSPNAAKMKKILLETDIAKTHFKAS